MKLFTAFLKLVRWPNLFFIALTQCLFFYGVLPFVYSPFEGINSSVDDTIFWTIVAASVFIAAGGYIINDYFDLNIDRVNKPNKLVIEKFIRRRWAIILHIIFSFIGLMLSVYAGYRLNNFYIPVLNFFSVVALWFYSTTFKKKLLVGNVLISLLTAWVILVITTAVYDDKRLLEEVTFSTRLLKVSFLYAGFAFVISLVREVVKDMQDIQGDARYGCRTMPIVWGIPVSKVFTAVWLAVLVGTLIVIQFYVWQLGWKLSVVYAMLMIILPLLWILRKLYDAQVSSDYSLLSNMIKAVMFTGILSMLIFGLYTK